MATSKELTAFNKAGVVTTDAAGVAYVVFKSAMPYGFQYVVSLAVVDAGNAVSAEAYPSSLTQNGFTITTRETKLTGGTYAASPNVLVYWIARSVYNE